MDEIWKPIAEFEGLYSVSSLGRVKREKGRTSNGKNWAEKILTPRQNRDGYVKYTLYKEGKPHYTVVHRLVCQAFYGDAPDGKPFALHRDDNPKNNSVGNLYWGDRSQNQLDIISNGNNFGRNKTQCVNKHDYTEENTYRNPKTGHRACQTCRHNYSDIQNQRRKEERNNR